jgi:DNA-binding beta-propeller fold protein YncE
MWFLSRRKPRPGTARRRPSYRPRLEALEDRCVPTLMQVASLSPAGGGLITLPSPTVQVTFSEAYDPASVGGANLTLSQGTVTGFSLTSATTVTYTLGGLQEGPLTVSLAAGAVAAANGDLLQPCSGNYEADLGAGPFPAPLAAANPSGALVYQGTASGLFNTRILSIVPPGSGGLDGSEKVLIRNGDLFVVSRSTNTIDRYDAATGAPLPAAGLAGAVFASGNGLSDPIGIGFGPDGNLYVANYSPNTVVRFDGTTGAGLGTFVPSGSGGLTGATGLAFGPDGNLYVSSRDSNQVMRYSGTTGAPLPSAGNRGAVFAQGGGLNGPDDLTFGPDGRLYVSSQFNNEVIAFNGATGAPAAAPFVSAGSGGLSQPLGVRFGPDGAFYVTSYQNNEVLRYQGLSGASPGAFLDAFVPPGADGRLSQPTGLAFGPDGRAYVTSRATSAVLRFDGTATGADDGDSYTLNLDANQSLALQVSYSGAVAPTVTLTHSVLGPVALGPSLGPGPGLRYQAVGFKDSSGNPVAGTVTITVQSPPGLTAGSYSIQATLNAQFDTAGDGSAPAQSLAPSTLDVDPSAGINRAAALGSVEKAVARVTTATAGVTNDLRGSWDQAGTSTTWNINNGSGVTGSLSKQAPTNTFSFYGRAGDVVTLRTRGGSSGGTLTKALLTLQDPNGVQTSGTQVTGASSDYAITNFTLTATGAYTVTVSTSKGGKGSYTLTASLVTPANPRPNAADVYAISAGAGQYLSFAAAVGDQPVGQAQVQLALYAPGVDPISGAPVATSNPSGVLDAWLDYNATATGVYEVKVTPGPGLTGSAVNYDLVGVDNGTFDNSANAGFSTAQDLTGRPGSVGALRHATSVFVPSGSGGLNYNEDLVVHNGSLFVVSRGNNAILRYDAATGAFLGTFASGNGLSNPIGMTFGPDGNLYVGNYGGNTVLRFNGGTGAFLGAFVTKGSGGLNGPTGVAFGADGNLYVASRDGNSVLCYNGTTGGFLSAFVPAGSGGLSGPNDLVFGPDGNLYVPSQFGRSVLRFNGSTGALIDAFVPAASGGLSQPLVARFGPDGDLYVTSYATNQVLRYQGPAGAQPGAFVDAFIPAGEAGLTNPTGLTFGPDGTLYTSSRGANSVLGTRLAPDFYKVTLSAGQTVTFNTLTPGDGPDVPANGLDPHIQLFDPTQAPVATGTKLGDGRNEAITYTAPAAGTYYVEITPQNFTEGDYVLDPVESGGGATVSTPPAPTADPVAASAPQAGSRSEGGPPSAVGRYFASAEDPYGSAAIDYPGANFGSGGFVTQAVGSGGQGRGGVVQSDGRIVVAGAAAVGGRDDFLLARFGPSAAQVGSFTAGPNPVSAGSSLTLTASNVTPADPGSTITQVAFYGDGKLEPGADALLGYAAQSSPGVWTLTFTVGLPPGTDTLFAQAEDGDAVFGDPDALSLRVM